MTSKCGTCTLCCKLLPVAEIDKGANTVCFYQRYFKGCSIYHERPSSCRTWSCLWLTDRSFSHFKRPDISHYVLDPSPDYVTVIDSGTQRSVKVSVLQIWVDPKYPDAHRDPKLRDYLESVKMIGLVRYNSIDALNLIPPSMNDNKNWVELVGVCEDANQHTTKDVFEFLKKKR